MANKEKLDFDLSLISDFDPMVGELHHTCYLPIEQIDFVCKYASNREELIIAVQWLKEEDQVKFLMGNLATITVPCVSFVEDVNGRMPDFRYPHVDDYGFLVKFGEYITNLGKILYLNE